MPETPDRFTVSSGASRLMVRSYAPASNGFSGGGVILLHGLLSSAEIFDVPGLEHISLARGLCREGLHVVSYDQRGTGESSTNGWKFGLREHALVDLPAVLTVCRERLGLDRLVVVGHSLGGTIWLRYVQSTAAAGPDPSQPAVVGGIAIASPAVFDRGDRPWSDFARRGRSFVESIDRDGNQIVTREEFAAAQVTLYWPWAEAFLHPALVRAAIQAGAASVFLAGILRRLPIPTLLYDRDDFDDQAFRCVLRSRTLDRGPAALLLGLIDEILLDPDTESGGTKTPPPVLLNTLCVGSGSDRLVPLKAVEEFGTQFAGARVISTEAQFGHPSGHAGYLFKAGVREPLAVEILDYVRKSLG